MTPAFHRRDARVAWTCSHRHNRIANADDAYVRCNLFAVRLPVPRGGALALPSDRRLRIVAASLAVEAFPPLGPLADPLTLFVPEEMR
jgi:hypothetical protein